MKMFDDFLLPLHKPTTIPPSAPSSPFRLPMTYWQNTHTLTDVVSSDLELHATATGEGPCMYEVLFQPTNRFGKDLIQQWKKHFSADPQYLQDTQRLLRQVTPAKEPVQDALMQEIWHETKESAGDMFLEKYCFVEWEWLTFMNKSPAILQILSVANLMSPVISLVMPFLFLLFPFLILKLRGLPITFQMYKDVLQDVARNHFIGKALTNLSSLSLDKAGYLVVMAGLYFWQIYQNVLLCQRFYRNIFRINAHLLAIKEFAQHTLDDMRQLLDQCANKPSYQPFCEDVRKHASFLESIVQDLDQVTPMTSILDKMGSVGYLLQRYYELHLNGSYEQGLLYGFGFQGYLDNLRGVKAHLDAGTVHAAKVLATGSTRFRQQVYPLHQPDGMCNDCSLDKNIILTGPNASGKTTFLKTTSINVIFSQQVGCGFYAKATVNPYTHIHSYLNIPDTSARDSLFQAESRRCKEILDAIAASDVATSRHFCIFDELYSGTNPTEAVQAGYAFLKYVNEFAHVDYVLTTHYMNMCKRFKKAETTVRNCQMGVEEEEAGAGGLKYTYKLKPGISRVQGAIRILEEMGYPWPILDTIRNNV